MFQELITVKKFAIVSYNKRTFSSSLSYVQVFYFPTLNLVPKIVTPAYYTGVAIPGINFA